MKLRVVSPPHMGPPWAGRHLLPRQERPTLATCRIPAGQASRASWTRPSSPFLSLLPPVFTLFSSLLSPPSFSLLCLPPHLCPLSPFLLSFHTQVLEARLLRQRPRHLHPPHLVLSRLSSQIFHGSLPAITLGSPTLAWHPRVWVPLLIPPAERPKCRPGAVRPARGP